MTKDVLTHAEITISEGISLVKGMNYHPVGKDYSIFLMSADENAPYNDGFALDGKSLSYEGHDINKRENEKPKSVDQTFFTRKGNLTGNGNRCCAVLLGCN